MQQEVGKALLVVFMEPKAEVARRVVDAAYQSAAQGRLVAL